MNFVGEGFFIAHHGDNRRQGDGLEMADADGTAGVDEATATNNVPSSKGVKR
jgi:hypothetical protein